MLYQLFRGYFSLGFENRPSIREVAPKVPPVRYAFHFLRGNTKNKQRPAGPFKKIVQYTSILFAVVSVILFVGSSIVAPNESLQFSKQITVIILVVSLAILVLYWVTENVASWRRHLKVAPLELFSWSMIATGIFARQNVNLKTFSWSFGHFSSGAFLLSCLIALVIFPWVMRRVTKFEPRPGLEVIALPFAFGFLLDLARFAAVTWVPNLS